MIKKIILVIILIIIATFALVKFLVFPQKTEITQEPIVNGTNTEYKSDKGDLIIIESPLLNQAITSPLVVRGKARGYWFFEASFPVLLVNWDGLIITESYATAKGDWMTEDFVPFEVVINFTIDKDTYSNRGAVILKKDNPSGLPEHDDALELPIIFSDVLNKN